MNIIKFNNHKFDLKTSDEHIKSNQTFFNKYLAGKYAYLIHQKYVFGFPTTEIITEKPAEYVPTGRLNMTINLNDDRYAVLRENNGVIKIPGGYKGVWVTNTNGSYHAFESACPQDNEISIELDNPFTLKCYECEKEYPILWDGKSTNGGANLHSYVVEKINDNLLRVTNPDDIIPPFEPYTVLHGISIHTYKRFDGATNEEIEADEEALDNYLTMDDIRELQKYSDEPLIDEISTSEINDINYYKSLNESVLDIETPEDQVRRFRQWLAETLIKNHVWNGHYTDDIDKLNGMLNYYAQNMFDNIIEGFILFPNTTVTPSITIQSGCDCGDSMTQFQVGPFDSTCDPISIYKMNIYNYMIKVFSDIEYWLGQRELCGMIKEYLDAIIKCNLPLSSTIVDRFEDCTCKNSNITEQDRLMSMLKSLSKSMEYITTKQESGNKNFILKSLNDWAKYLYEKMYWM